ncbi:MAG: PQQ-binding-like beta-propeller repeat protein, partial [Planctomycetota bacterium]
MILRASFNTSDLRTPCLPVLAFLALSVSQEHLSPQSLQAADFWNQWRGENRDGRIELAISPKLNLQEARWSVPLQPSYSGPVVQDGLIFTTETVDQKNERVTAFKLDTGEQVWQSSWSGSLTVPFFAAANGSWIRSTPAVAPGHLVVFGMRDTIVDLDPKTGSQRWLVSLPDQLGTPVEKFGGVCSPLIDGEHVFVQTGGGLMKFALADGSVIWKVLEDDGGMSGGAFSSPAMATIAGVRQLLVQTRLELTGVDPETGNVLWRTPIDAFRGMNILTPLAVGDAVFTAAHSGRSELYDVSFDGENWTVNLRWEQKSQGYMSSPVIVGEHIYLHMKNQRMTCLSIADGTIA